MEKGFLPLFENDTSKTTTEKDIIYIGEKAIQSGYFNSKTYKGMYNNDDVYVKKIPGLFPEKDKLFEEFEQLKNLHCQVNILAYIHCTVSDNEIQIVSETWETTLTLLLMAKDLILHPCNIIRQCAIGLDHLHDNNICHGNLKPCNILVYPDRRLVKLSDFGVPSIYGELTKSFLESGMYIGIADWMGPEILREFQKRTFHWNIDPKSDIFSLGCIFYFIISDGIHPFGNIWSRAKNILENKTVLDKISVDDMERVLSIIVQMISPDLEDRPSAKSLAQNTILRDCYETQQVSTKASSSQQPSLELGKIVHKIAKKRASTEIESPGHSIQQKLVFSKDQISASFYDATVIQQVRVTSGSGDSVCRIELIEPFIASETRDEDDGISTTYVGSPKSTSSTATFLTNPDDLDLTGPFDGSNIPKEVWAGAFAIHDMKQGGSLVDVGKVLFDAIFSEEEISVCSFSRGSEKEGIKFNPNKIDFLKKAIAWILSSPIRPREFKVGLLDEKLTLSAEDNGRIDRNILIEYAYIRKRKILHKT